ncbi:hypothetical protein [Shinella zoogloeoides]|jgi:hypothetical protein|uniref:hypothetical protein n=1 Tax=Shinella TaxID=323620 RepID=UPI0028ADFE4C|nr:hypothetical protein [Shinella zoogloeoides]
MINAMQDAVHSGLDPQSADFLDRFAETIRAESGMDLPHAYFVEEARLRLSHENVHAIAGRRARPEPLRSSACFDCWARDEDAA